jgi:hypothetical protein
MSQYRIGTATFTQNSNVVTGQGTSWLGNVSAGNWIVRQGFGTTTYEAYQVASVASNTSLTLTAPYGGTTATAVAYVIAVDMLPNGIPELSNGDLETATIQNRANARLPAGLMGAAATLNTTSGPTGQANGLLWRTNDLVKQTNPTDAAAGRVMTVGAFGLGNAVVINGEDLDTMSVPGIYSITSLSGAANMPPSSQEGTLYVGGYAGGPTYRVTQLYIDLGGRMWVRSARNSWLAWRELYHTGNLTLQTSPTDATAGRVLTTGAGGLLSQAGNLTTDFNALFTQPTQISRNTAFRTALTMKYDETRGTQLVIDISGVRAFIVGLGTTGGTPVQNELYHTGNLNTLEFGGESGERSIGSGFADGSTTCIINIPINLINSPNSIVVTGTFTLKNATAGNINTSLTSTNIGMNAARSNRILRLRITGLTGLTAGQPVELFHQSSAKITVNP